MADIDPNLFASLAAQYTGGIAAPVAGQAGYTAIVNAAENNLEYVAAQRPTVSADNGDSGASLTVLVDDSIQIWSTPLTADRAVTLSTSEAFNGAHFRVVREATATGAFDLNVGSGPLKALAVGEWCEVAYNGASWKLTASGSL